MSLLRPSHSRNTVDCIQISSWNTQYSVEWRTHERVKLLLHWLKKTITPANIWLLSAVWKCLLNLHYGSGFSLVSSDLAHFFFTENTFTKSVFHMDALKLLATTQGQKNRQDWKILPDCKTAVGWQWSYMAGNAISYCYRSLLGYPLGGIGSYWTGPEYTEDKDDWWWWRI